MRGALSNILLVLAAVLLSYLAAEAAFSVLGLRYVPLRLHADLPADIRPFAQSSKAGVIPRDPIVLVGDSYAQGYGDWLLESNPDRNAPFHSGNVIHELAGRDVITLGQSGAGSAEGIAALPANAYASNQTAWYLRLPQPDLAVVYFYEGNDLNNNLAFLQKHASPNDTRNIVEAVDAAITRYPVELTGPQQSSSHFPLFGFLQRIALRSFREWRGVAVPLTPERLDAARSAKPEGRPNLVEVAGRQVSLPPDLQSPALELTDLERNQAVLVFSRSLAFMKKLFPAARVLVVYVPSPLSSYKLVGPEISAQPYMEGRAVHFPTERVAQTSDAICDLIRAASIVQAAGFVDLRPAIRAASALKLVHGPRDFKHFNRAGMTVLGTTVAATIERPAAPGTCSGGQQQ